MSKRTLITAFGCILLAFYLLVSVAWSRFQAREEKCAGLENDCVEVIDPEGLGFVTAEELTAELFASLPDTLTSIAYSDLDLAAMQEHLRSLDKIEAAEVVRLSDDRLRVSVKPMKPVARIWPLHGRSYYVNRAGKRIAASSKYRIDVMPVTGRFDSLRSELVLLPLLDHLASRPSLEQMISMVNATDTNNIILVPAMRGHVVNLGRPDNIADKIARLETFYRRVLPVKGWEFYDTLSLKWDGQLVATRRHGKMPDLSVKIIDELENEADDLSTMSTAAVSVPETDNKNIKQR